MPALQDAIPLVAIASGFILTAAWVGFLGYEIVGLICRLCSPELALAFDCQHQQAIRPARSA